MWKQIETAPMDQFLLLCGPSEYTTTPMVVTTGRMCSDYHAGRWIDHANDDLIDWGFRPTHWAPLVLPGAQPSGSIKDDIIDDLQSQFDTEGITEHDSGDALIRLYHAVAAVEDNFALAQPAQKEVAYLDIGTGGYMDIGTDLNDEQLASLPKGRHMLGIVGTYGVDGYVSAQPAPGTPEGWKLVPTAESRHPGIYKMLGALHTVDNTPGASEWESYAALLAAAPEAKPCL